MDLVRFYLGVTPFADAARKDPNRHREDGIPLTIHYYCNLRFR